MSSTSQVPVLVLAGGLGTRLKDLSKQTPKYLMPVGKKVFADFHLQWLADQGFQKVFLSIGHLGEKIVEHCEDGAKWNLEIHYLFDGETPLGTGGAIREALRFRFQNLAVTYGDTLLQFNVNQFLDEFASSGAWAGMTYCENLAGHQPNVDPKQKDRIFYNKKNPDPKWNYIDYGFLALQREFIESFSAEKPLDLAAPLQTAAERSQLMGFFCQERFWEIGSPEALESFQKKHATKT